MVMREINEQESLSMIFGPSQYISQSYVIKRESYINQLIKKHICGQAIFVVVGEQRKQMLMS
jgi:hypothetical protein